MSEQDVEALAEALHDAYEMAAAEQGWETQERSRKPWADVPEANKATMRAMIRAAVLPHVAAARAEALTEAADAWLHGQWADAPRCADRIQERIANAQHVGDWLRARAEDEAGMGSRRANAGPGSDQRVDDGREGQG